MREMLNEKSRRVPQYFVLTLLLAAMLVPGIAAKADAGPKSGMYFEFVLPNNQISIIDGKLLICPDKDCSISRDNPFPFGCQENSCLATPGAAMWDYKYYKIIITFTDGVRESNTFQEQSEFNSNYVVTIDGDQDHLHVQPTLTLSNFFNPWTIILFIASSILTIPVEAIVALIYFWVIKVKKAFVQEVVIANVLSLSILWFVLPLLFNGWYFLYVGEAFVTIFEATYLFFVGRHISFPIRHAVLLSVLMNLTSFLLGLWLVSPYVFR